MTPEQTKEMRRLQRKTLKNLISCNNKVDIILERIKGMKKLPVTFDVTENKIPVTIKR